MLQYIRINVCPFITKVFFRMKLHLFSILCISGAKERISEVFTVLIQYLENPDSDPTVSCVFLFALLNITHFILSPTFFYWGAVTLKATPSLTDCFYFFASLFTI